MAAAGFALKPGTPESRTCSSYSGGLCLIKILYKRSHFTKPARVSLTSPPGRINKRGHLTTTTNYSLLLLTNYYSLILLVLLVLFTD